MSISVSELIPVLQVAIGPVILVSGVGLLLLTMTNRLGRVIDRSRTLWRELQGMPEEARPTVRGQLAILTRRAETIRWAITLASLSVLFAAVLVIVLFFTALLRWEDAWLIGLLFGACMLTLIGAMIAFIYDVNQSLAALRLEIGDDQLEG